VKARALCLLGDFASSGAQPDYRRSMQYHTQAIKTAEALAADPHPAIRLAAKEVLVDAHLGAAHDIAWGTWNNKEAAIAVWLKRASEFAEDLIRSDGGSIELRFRVAARALAACVGMQGKLDSGPWSDQVLRVGQELIAAAAAAPRKQQVQREMGLALYDAVQVDQMRNDRAAALKRGQRAIECLESLGPPKDRPADAYLLGRLYFRMGAIRAGAEKNHRASMEWFDKAVAVLQQAAPQVAPSERGRLGETLVSMGVSYWETDQREKAIKISHQGIEWMEKAVQDGSLPKTALDVPYSNLASMHRQLGQNDEARRFTEKIRAKPDTMRR
jgi:tetratricopeptide (TPR) repeat protein